jgi:hypothetical protein
VLKSQIQLWAVTNDYMSCQAFTLPDAGRVFHLTRNTPDALERANEIFRQYQSAGSAVCFKRNVLRASRRRVSFSLLFEQAFVEMSKC